MEHDLRADEGWEDVTVGQYIDDYQDR